jgi:hypothetical protein
MEKKKNFVFCSLNFEIEGKTQDSSMASHEKMCRICLNSGSLEELTQISSNQNEIALKIYSVSGVSVRV